MTRALAHEHGAGVTWLMDEPLGRAWHALAHEGRVWLVDPLDDAAALARAEALGEIAGVVQLLDRHDRDCAALAARLGVPHERVPRALAGSPFEVVEVLRMPVWAEVALWWPARRALVVAEVVGTNPVWAAGPVAAGVHPFVRLWPPGGLGRFAPELLLVGHGPPLEGRQAAEDLRAALARTRRDIPRLALRLPHILRMGRHL